jgi:hypothetical protein
MSESLMIASAFALAGCAWLLIGTATYYFGRLVILTHGDAEAWPTLKTHLAIWPVTLIIILVCLPLYAIRAFMSVFIPALRIKADERARWNDLR